MFPSFFACFLLFTTPFIQTLESLLLLLCAQQQRFLSIFLYHGELGRYQICIKNTLLLPILIIRTQCLRKILQTDSHRHRYICIGFMHVSSVISRQVHTKHTRYINTRLGLQKTH